MKKILLKNSTKVAILLIFIQIVFSQTKDMVITRENGSIDYVPTSGIENITFVEAGTTGTVTDFDGNVYQTVKIGNQWWMAENLKVTNYRNGVAIPNVTDADTWEYLTSGAYCYYNNDSNNGTTYGCLYNWYAVIRSDLAPEGWHVPTEDEWQELEDYLTDNGFSGTEGTALKSTSGWYNDGNGTNDFGFNGLPAGFRYWDGYYYNMGDTAYFWSATEGSSSNAWYRRLTDSHTNFYRAIHYKEHGFSVRCVRD